MNTYVMRNSKQILHDDQTTGDERKLFKGWTTSLSLATHCCDMKADAQSVCSS